jgi:kinesin family protein 13
VGVARLREELVQANALVREANLLAEELSRPVSFSVTLQEIGDNGH